MRKIIASIVGTLVAAVMIAGTAHAQAPAEFTSMTGGNSSFTYTSGAAGGLTLGSGFYASLDVPTAGSAINNPALVMFTGLANSGTTQTVVFNGATQFAQNLTGGTFLIKNATGTLTLLSGTFSGATLSGTIGTNQAGVDTNFNNVVYTGGTYATAANVALNMNPGYLFNKFNFSLINVTPTLTTGGTPTYVSSFTSAGNGQFTGLVNAPEPGTYAAFAFTGIGVMGLMLRARKGRGSMSA